MYICSSGQLVCTLHTLIILLIRYDWLLSLDGLAVVVELLRLCPYITLRRCLYRTLLGRADGYVCSSLKAFSNSNLREDSDTQNPDASHPLHLLMISLIAWKLTGVIWQVIVYRVLFQIHKLIQFESQIGKTRDAKIPLSALLQRRFRKLDIRVPGTNFL